MADIGQVEACWSELSSFLDSAKIIPVTYMNSTAAIKAFTGEHGGSVCTSSNAAAVMKWAFESGGKVLFLPDEARFSRLLQLKEGDNLPSASRLHHWRRELVDKLTASGRLRRNDLLHTWHADLAAACRRAHFFFSAAAS